MERKRIACVAALLFCVCPLHAQERDAARGRLPVKRVVLFKNGVGYFEHVGTIQGNESVTIGFTSGQLNDVLKSLTVLDLDGGHIADIAYGSAAPVDRQLGDLRLPIGEKATLAEFLGALRGTRLEVKNGASVITGRLLSIERKTRISGGTTLEVDYLSLISDNWKDAGLSSAQAEDALYQLARLIRARYGTDPRAILKYADAVHAREVTRRLGLPVPSEGRPESSGGEGGGSGPLYAPAVRSGGSKPPSVPRGVAGSPEDSDSDPSADGSFLTGGISKLFEETGPKGNYSGLGAFKDKFVRVDEARPTQANFAVTNISSDQLALFVSQRSIDPTIESALREVLAQTNVIAGLENRKESQDTETQKIFDDQQRLRENIKALKGTPEEKALLQRYTQQLNEQESRLSILQKEGDQLDAQIDAAKAKRDEMIQRLTFDVKL